jgi:hypothetical protein
MALDTKEGLRDLIRDSSIVLAVLTATAYVLGTLQIAQVASILGLNDLVAPDVDFKDVIMIGGVTEIVILSVLCFCFIFFKHLFNVTADPRGELAQLTRLARKGLFYCVVLLLVLGLNYALGLLNGRLFKHQLHRVKELDLSSRAFPNPTQLVYMGQMGNFTLFERVEDPGKGDTVLIPEDDIKSLTLSPDSPP